MGNRLFGHFRFDQKTYDTIIIIISVKNTAEHAPTATVRSPFPLYAINIAARSPATADSIFPVAYIMAGNVIAASTVYGI